MMNSSDILDVAAERTQREIDSLIAEHRARKTKIRSPKGSCYSCDEPLEHDKTFCDTYCRDDFQYLEERKKANGK